jgi:hypothetical protein
MGSLMLRDTESLGENQRRDKTCYPYGPPRDRGGRWLGYRPCLQPECRGVVRGAVLVLYIFAASLTPRGRLLQRIHVRPKFLTITYIVLLP